jgi:hypothetical protein
MKLFQIADLGALVAVLVLAGCSTPAGQHGAVYVGDTPAMVQGVLGPPDEKKSGPDAGGHQSTWIYANYQPEPRQSTGWSEVLVSGVNDQNDQVLQKPVTHEIYRPAVKENLRVVFTDGLVSSIEHLKL